MVSCGVIPLILIAVLKHNRLAWIVTACIPLVSVIGLASMPPLTECNLGPPTNSRDQIFQAHYVVVQPWKGPHHVYGIFSLPVQYRRDRLYAARLVILGVAEDLQAISPELGPADWSSSEASHYMMRVQFQTRKALWILLTGRFGDLQSACHWWLVIAERVR